jgi:hypothetical protein
MQVDGAAEKVGQRLYALLGAMLRARLAGTRWRVGNKD